MIRKYEDYVNLQNQVQLAKDAARDKILEFYKEYELGSFELPLEDNETMIYKRKYWMALSIKVLNNEVSIYMNDEEGDEMYLDFDDVSLEIMGSISEEIDETDADYLIEQLLFNNTERNNHTKIIKKIIKKHKPDISESFLSTGMKKGLEEYLSSYEFQKYYFDMYGEDSDKIKLFTKYKIPFDKEILEEFPLLDSAELGLL